VLVVSVLLLAGCWVDVGRPPGWQEAIPNDVNKAGGVVVAAHSNENNGRRQMFLRTQRDTWTPIGVENQDAVLALDESGNAVGGSISPDGLGCAAIWPAGEPGRCLSAPGGRVEQGYARDINETGIVVGESGSLPVIWTRTGEPSTLPLVHPSDTWGRVHAINAQGVMVGVVGGPDSLPEGQAVRWDSPTSPPVELEVEPGALGSQVWAISNHGVMVGSVVDAGWHVLSPDLRLLTRSSCS
jgi:uncharacterized membrane protein